MNNKWTQIGSVYKISEITCQLNSLPKGVYTLNIDIFNNLFLEHIGDSYLFPYKVYNVQQEFIDRVKTTFDNTKSNLGILLNGIKGTGKSVTCEMICNKLELPVILITKDLAGMVPFMNQIQQEVIFFFDEFEKIFDNDYHASQKMLSVMDGALKNGFKKVFLLTTNSLYIDDNLIQRPGRIRYLKKFANLGKSEIEEIIDDKLINKDFKDDLIEVISQLELITIDIVISMIHETNVFNESPKQYLDIFNVKKMSDSFDVYYVDPVNGKEHLIYVKAKTKYPKFYKSYIGQYLNINNTNIGTIEDVKDESTVLISINSNNDNVASYKDDDEEPIEDSTSKNKDDPFGFKGLSPTLKTATLRFEKRELLNYSFLLA